MIIRRLYIENFGHFHDFSLDLNPGVNRIRRENEFGKSTLFEFIRRVMWGFPDRRSRLNPYPARFNSGRYGGFMEVECSSGEVFRLERFGERGSLLVRSPDGRQEDGGEFLRRLTPVSGDCYRNVYAVTLDELSRLSSLDADEIRGRLYGGAIAMGDVSLPELGRLLDGRTREMFRPRGDSRLGAARREMLAVSARLDAALNAAVRRAELERERAEMEDKERLLRRELAACVEQLTELDALSRAAPVYAELTELERRLGEGPEVPDVPDEAVTRAEGMEARIEAMRQEVSAAAVSSAALAGELAEVDAELASRGSGPLPLPDPGAYSAARELEQEAAALCLRPPESRWVPVGILIFIAAVVVAICIPSAGWVMIPGVIAGGWAFWLRRRVRMTAASRRAEWERRCAAFAAGYNLSCPPEEFCATLVCRERRERIAGQLRVARDREAAVAAVGELRRGLTDLCSRYGCTGTVELRRLAELAAERRELLRIRAEKSSALNALLGGAPAVDRRSGELHAPEAVRARRDAVAARREELERSLSLLQRQTGALAGELERLPGEGEIELLRTEAAAAENAIRAAVRQYLVFRGCRRLLDAAVARYERESQPEVLRRAAELFSAFTSGRYPRIYKSVATGDLIACDAASGLEKTFDALSRGTREELMIAMRLALIECTEKQSEPLPVVFDDIGVNFDPVRLRAVETAVGEFAAGRQVLWFSHS